MRPGQDGGPPLTGELTEARGVGPRIFVSHLHTDGELVKALVELLESAFAISERDVRCTSGHQYALPLGDHHFSSLRETIRDAEVVIGVITPLATESGYVVCELGAAWGLERPTFIVVANGATIRNVPPPVNQLSWIEFANRDACGRFLRDIEARTSLRRMAAGDLEALERASGRLVQLAAEPAAIQSDWEYLHPEAFLGDVWCRLEGCTLRAVDHEVRMRWGGWAYSTKLPLVKGRSVFWIHEKRQVGLEPLHVHVRPACRLEFGVGAPPSEGPAFVIGHSWQRVDQPGRAAWAPSPRAPRFLRPLLRLFVRTSGRF